MSLETVKVAPAAADHRAWEGHAGPLLDSANGFDVIACERCRYRHVVPIPTPEELATQYRHDYYSTLKPLYIERMVEDQRWWALSYADRYDDLERLLEPGRRRLLDIGSGAGYFLLEGQRRGWSAVGIEPAVQAAEHARGLGLDVRNEFLTEERAAELGPFDAVHLSEVLEHLPDPGAMLRLARTALAPGGLVYVAVPNDYSPFQQAAARALDARPWWLAPPQHLNYFDRATLGALLERNGYEVVQVETTFPIDIFLLMGVNYLGNDAQGRTCHGWRKQMELTMDEQGLTPLRRQLYRKLAELDVGRELLVVGRRVDDGAGTRA